MLSFELPAGRPYGICRRIASEADKESLAALFISKSENNNLKILDILITFKYNIIERGE